MHLIGAWHTLHTPCEFRHLDIQYHVSLSCCHRLLPSMFRTLQLENPLVLVDMLQLS